VTDISRWSRLRRCWTSGGRCCVRLMPKCPRDSSTWTCFYRHSSILMSMTRDSGSSCCSVLLLLLLLLLLRSYRRQAALLTLCSILAPPSNQFVVSVTSELLSLASHVSHHVTSVCCFHLRQLRLVRRSLTIDTAHALVRALIHSRLDYCNGMSAGLPAGLYNCLQSVLRAAARLVLGLPGRAPVMSAIRDKLHWLSYRQRVTFKLCLTTYKCLHGLAPPYLTHRSPPSPVTHSRSVDQHKLFLFVPRTSTSTFGPWAFCSSGHLSWNALPSQLRDPAISVNIFRQSLKTYLFNNYSD